MIFYFQPACQRRNLKAKALNTASARECAIVMLSKSSQGHGGSITIDAIGKMRTLVPNAQLYAWLEKSDDFAAGRVHVKPAVAIQTLALSLVQS